MSDGIRVSGRVRAAGVIVLLGCAIVVGAILFVKILGGRADDRTVFNRAVCLLEEHRYHEAASVFRSLANRAPEWRSVRWNHVLSLVAIGTEDSRSEARDALETVPESPDPPAHAWFLRGAIALESGDPPTASDCFSRVCELDPLDAHARFFLARALRRAGRTREAVSALEEAVRLQPALRWGWAALAEVYRELDRDVERASALSEYERLVMLNESDPPSFRYGMGGRYTLAATSPPVAPVTDRGSPKAWETVGLDVALGAAIPFAPPSIGEDAARGAEQPPAFAVGDLTGDGVDEVVLCGVPTEDGPRIAAYSAVPGGSFEKLFVLPFDAALCAVGDVDTEATNEGLKGRDIVAAGPGWVRVVANGGKDGFLPRQALYRAAGGGADEAGDPSESDAFYEEVSLQPGAPVRLHLVDLDGDWDLDVLVLRRPVREARGDAGSTALGVLDVLENRGGGALAVRDLELRGDEPPARVDELVLADWDRDGDSDPLLIDGQSGRAVVLANDLGWRFRVVRQDPRLLAPGVRASLAGDVDSDGLSDLVALCGGEVHLWRNAGGLQFTVDEEFAEGGGRRGGTCGVVFDFSGALRQDLLVLDPTAGGPAYVFGHGVGASEVPGLRIADDGHAWMRAAALQLGDPALGHRPLLIVYDRLRGARAFPIVSAARGLVVELRGATREMAIAGAERANVAGIGASVEVRAGDRSSTQFVGTGACGTIGGGGRLYFGVSPSTGADCLRVLWPDGVRQGEPGAGPLASYAAHEVVEVERRPIAPGDAARWMHRGVLLLEQYLYLPALKLFEKLSHDFPDWSEAHVNRGIAALNLQTERYLAIAQKAFARALELDPDALHAHHSLGILYSFTNRREDALAAFQRVVDGDPDDPHAHYFLAKTYEELGRKDAALRHFQLALRLQPSFASAWYRLAQLHAQRGEIEKRIQPLQEFQRLDVDGRNMGVLVGFKYGEGGKYNLAVRDAAPPGAAPGTRVAAPRPLVVGARRLGRLADPGTRPDGRPQSPGLAMGDLDGDGILDLAASPVTRDTESGVGVWTSGEDGPLAAAQLLAWDAIVCALGDLDGDGDLDLVGAGSEGIRMFRNDGRASFEPTGIGAELARGEFPVRIYVADADSDWDLDIACLLQVRRESGALASRVELLRNNGDGSFEAVGDACGLGDLPYGAAEMALADWDGDVDLDLLLIDGETGQGHQYANDRLWKYRAVPADDLSPRAPGVRSTTGWDADSDGDEDLILFSDKTLRLWRNDGALRFRDEPEFTRRYGEIGGTAGVVFDFVCDMHPGLVVLDPWSSDKAKFLASPRGEVESIDLGVAAGARGRVTATAALLAEGGEAGLIVADPVDGLRIVALSLPWPWIALDLNGPSREDMSLDKEHSNLSGIGSTVEIAVEEGRAVRHLNTGTGGSAREAPRAFFGLRGRHALDYVRILWPDGVLQSERGLVEGRLHRVREVDRKPTSCPVLFAWDGTEFRFVADFLGVGGLGYFQTPGSYGTPDPTELLVIPELEPRRDAHGARKYSLRVLEPLEECAYLDALSLVAVRHPRDTTVLPLEMFAVAGPAPGFELLAFRRSVVPRLARDGDGHEVTEDLLAVDGKRAPELRRHASLKGYLEDTQSLVLEFGDDIDALLVGDDEELARADASPADRAQRVVAFLHGYIEYGYSTTNYAAWQRRTAAAAPTFRVERQGRWEILRDDWGFPGGYPRWMAVDLTGLLRPGDRRIRIDTNLEIAWDHIRIARAVNAGAAEGVRIEELEPDTADLHFRGFPFGPIPGVEGFLYRGFHHVEQFKVMPGAYTRYGDVRDLLREADDRLAILGPGDEVSLDFRADRLSEVGQDARRTFLLKATGWCKDMDLYTAHPERVEPLPFHGMRSYPYADGESYPSRPELEQYRAEWNTRRVEGGPRTPVEDLARGRPGS